MQIGYARGSMQEQNLDSQMISMERGQLALETQYPRLRLDKKITTPFQI